MSKNAAPIRDVLRDAFGGFHPAVAAWFHATYPAPTPAQQAAWPLLHAGRSVLVAAPTGSGKTLTAFLAAIDALVQRGLKQGGSLPDETAVLYISPLKALSNDIRLNLEAPLDGIARALDEMGHPAVAIRTAVRTGDTPARERTAMAKRPPHIVVTTPESFYVLLGSVSGRRMLSTVQTVIVDEIHAVAGSKRGSHLALSLARLDALVTSEQPSIPSRIRPLRVGLSATQRPIERIACFLVGAGAPCEIVDIGHHRERDLALEVPPAPLEAVMSNEVWERVYDRLADYVARHCTTLVFVNTRRMAERAARHLSERLGAEVVAAHHGSLAKEHRLDAEQRLKRGALRVLVATASLELGIDIGDVDLVCQLGSPRSVAAFLQRVGRSGHQVGGMPKGRLFPTSRDDLIECAALIDSVERGELDAVVMPSAPLDVLSQQIVAEVACGEWNETALYDMIRNADPYRSLTRERYDAVVRMLSDGYTSRHGPRGAYLHRDVVGNALRARRGAMLTAVSAGGTIPENADYAVQLEPQNISIGTVNEDFAVESLAGDVFQLGNASYRILKIEAGRVRVEDAKGQPPNIPFWLGEAPGRSDVLSMSVARLRANIDSHLAHSPATALAWLVDVCHIEPAAAQQIVDYLAVARAALTVLPTQETLILERFFDESGAAQLVLHAPFGSRVNRAWGLALRKRFCRTFNFELQAAATEDAIVLSLSTSHSFALDEVWRYLHSNSAEDILIQALLDAPLFGVRWRWNATTALALPRFSAGRKVAPQLQRMKSEDMLATVFPDQVACLENIVGEREVPAHPLVEQTLDDCLHEAMDCDAWLAILRKMESGEIRLLTRDLPAPSPLAAEILNARPYAFLDDAPLEERRTQAVLNRRWRDPQSSDDLGALDADAIVAVRNEAWPRARDTDEMHQALMSLGCINEKELAAFDAADAGREDARRWLASLAAGGRATRLQIAQDDALWVAIERLTCVQAIYPEARRTPLLSAPAGYDQVWSEDSAVQELLRARLGGLGPSTLSALARPLALPASQVALAMIRLEAEGSAMRGRFTPGSSEDEWCERHLLARIHRYTLKRLRREIAPVAPRDFIRFLLDWQHLSPGTRTEGPEALMDTLVQLSGFEVAASAWESDVLPMRVRDYDPRWLDDACRSGRMTWARLLPTRSSNASPNASPNATSNAVLSVSPVRATPIVLLPRRDVVSWHLFASGNTDSLTQLSPRAQTLKDVLARHGAMFFEEICDVLPGRLPIEIETTLGELVAAGEISSDSFAGLRTLTAPAASAARRGSRTRSRRPGFPATSRSPGAFIGGMADAGRWALLRRERLVMSSPSDTGVTHAEAVEHVAMSLLRRYGVVFWRLMEREPEWLPPWRELLSVFRRMEARGEIRGGRFVDGVGGEQFALPEAIPVLREVRQRPYDGRWTAVCGVDPLNLVGTVLVGDKVPALAGNRVLYRDGLALARSVAGRFQYDEVLTHAEREEARLHLVRSA